MAVAEPEPQVAEDLLEIYDQAAPPFRYWASVALLIAAVVLDVFDYFVVGYMVSILGPAWRLTYLQSSIMLLGGGVGTILGALVAGTLADRLGRKWMIVAGVSICGLCSAATAAIPAGNWLAFAILRGGVGVGIGTAAAGCTTLLVEYTPTRLRTLIPSLVVAPVALGLLLAASLVAALSPVLGWRGLSLLGIAPLILGGVIAWVVPESARWLLLKGRIDQARGIIARHCGRPVLNATWSPPPAAPAPVGFRELLRHPAAFWLTVISWLGASTANYGVFLWGPMITALLLGIPTAQAAKMFAVVALAGLIGRIAFSFLPAWIGRRPSGQLMGFGTAICLAGAGLFAHHTVFGWSAFVVLVALGALFFDGGLANMSPYPAELFPVGLAARGVGLAQAANGVGKIAGPLCMALIAGADNQVQPAATIAALQPTFLFLAACGLMVGLVFTFIPIETRGRALKMAG